MRRRMIKPISVGKLYKLKIKLLKSGILKLMIYKTLVQAVVHLNLFLVNKRLNPQNI